MKAGKLNDNAKFKIKMGQVEKVLGKQACGIRCS
jgi:hypothetical protein